MSESANQNRSPDFTPQEKASSLTWRIASGQEFTVREVADNFGMTWHGANRLLGTISRVIPIAPNSTGKWKRFDMM